MASEQGTSAGPSEAKDETADEVTDQAGSAPGADERDGGASYPRDEFDVDVVPGQRRGAHRAAAPPLLVVVPWLLVGLFVVALLVTVITFVGGSPLSPSAAPSPTATVTEEAPATPEAPPPPEIDKGVLLHVLNGTRSVRLTTLRTRLENDGWIVESIKNNTANRNVETTSVIYKSEDLRPTAQALVDFLGAGGIAQDPSIEEEMRVTIGNDYRG